MSTRDADLPTRSVFCSSVLLASIVLVALLLEWTVRDALPIIAVLYYATPMPLVAAAALVALTVAVLRERLGQAIVCALLLCAAVATQRSTLIHTQPPRAEAVRSVRGLLWNTWRARPGLRRAIHEIRRHDPDFFVLVEPPVGPQGHPLVALRERLPEYRFGFVTKHFVVGARDGVRVSERIDLEGGNAARATVTARDMAIELLCVDVRSNPLMSRRAPLAAVAALAAECPDGPALVVGDFNTPRRSVHFDPLRAGWSHAFEAAGSGHDATWPEPLPVHALDHVWGRGVRFVDCRIVPTSLSDHRLVVFSLAPE